MPMRKNGLDAIKPKNDCQRVFVLATLSFQRIVGRMIRLLFSTIELVLINRPSRALQDAIAKNIALLYTKNSFFVKFPRVPAAENSDLKYRPMKPKQTFTLAHLSDPHLAYPRGSRFSEFLNKRFFGYLKWRLKRKSKHHTEVFAEMIQDIRNAQPDHIVVTGDLTHLGLAAEYAKAKKMLEALGSASEVTIIPGNHDAYVNGALDCRLVDWLDYMVSDGEKTCEKTDAEVHAIFPSLRVRDGVALIGVSTAQPCSTFLAVGCVGNEQLQRLQKILIETGRKGLFRIILIHHPPKFGVVSWRKRLTDAQAFQKTVKDCGAELILHGHSHHQSRTYLETSAGRIPVIGVPSASAAGENLKRRARYHLYHLAPKADGWGIRVSVRSYVDKDKRYVTENEFRLTD
jgi:metallophosphoesterase superfamily enzyme